LGYDSVSSRHGPGEIVRILCWALMIVLSLRIAFEAIRYLIDLTHSLHVGQRTLDALSIANYVVSMLIPMLGVAIGVGLLRYRKAYACGKPGTSRFLLFVLIVASVAPFVFNAVELWAYFASHVIARSMSQQYVDATLYIRQLTGPVKWFATPAMGVLLIALAFLLPVRMPVARHMFWIGAMAFTLVHVAWTVVWQIVLADKRFRYEQVRPWITLYIIAFTCSYFVICMAGWMIVAQMPRRAAPVRPRSIGFGG
jgi:hypothetical protein